MIQRVPFTSSLLGSVQRLYFGDEPWGRGAARWIQSATRMGDCAVEHLTRGECDVWLYLWRSEPIGFTSLMELVWHLDGSPRNYGVVPWVAVAQRFWGVTLGNDRPIKVVDHLLNDLARECTLRKLEGLALFVAEDNLRAQKVYRRHGFVPSGPPRYDRNDDGFRIRLVKPLHASGEAARTQDSSPGASNGSPSGLESRFGSLTGQLAVTRAAESVGGAPIGTIVGFPSDFHQRTMP